MLLLLLVLAPRLALPSGHPMGEAQDAIPATRCWDGAPGVDSPAPGVAFKELIRAS